MAFSGFGLSTGAATTSAPFSFGTATATTNQQNNAAKPFSGLGGLGGLGGLASSTTGTGGGLLGAAAATNPTANTGGLFGGAATNTAGTGGGLFGTGTAGATGATGTTGTGTTPFGTGVGLGGASLGGAASGGTGLGGAGLGGAGLGAGTSSLFGSAASKPQTGAATTAPSTGLFSTSQAQPQPGTNTTNPTVTSYLYSTGGGTNLLGALGQVAPGQSLVSGVSIDLSDIRPTTRFSDLKPEIQQKIIQIQEFITAQISKATACAAVMQTVESGNDASRLPIDLELIPTDVEMMATKHEKVANTLERDTITILGLKNLIKSAEADLSSVRHAIESVKLPSAMKMNGLWNHYFGASRHSGRPDLGASASRMSGPVAEALEDRKTGSSQDIVGLFQTRSKLLESELENIKKLIGTIEGHLRLVENRAAMEVERLARSQHGAFNAPVSTTQAMTGEDGLPKFSPRMQEMIDTMRLFEGAILRVARRIGELRERLVELSMNSLPPL